VSLANSSEAFAVEFGDLRVGLWSSLLTGTIRFLTGTIKHGRAISQPEL